MKPSWLFGVIFPSTDPFVVKNFLKPYQSVIIRFIVNEHEEKNKEGVSLVNNWVGKLSELANQENSPTKSYCFLQMRSNDSMDLLLFKNVKIFGWTKPESYIACIYTIPNFNKFKTDVNKRLKEILKRRSSMKIKGIPKTTPKLHPKMIFDEKMPILIRKECWIKILEHKDTYDTDIK